MKANTWAILMVALGTAAPAQEVRRPQDPSAAVVAAIGTRVQLLPDLRYTGGHSRGVLDLYVPVESGPPQPTVIYFHGGGARKDQMAPVLTPFLAAGFNVANVEYRMLEDAPAPAAVEDAVCATRWLASVAPRHGLDPRRFVVTGNSAGGHLALMAGLAGEEFGGRCTALPPVRPAAVISLFSVADFEEFVFGPHATPGRSWAQRWLRSGGRELARRVSPRRYVRAGGAPVLSIHGEQDRLIPVAQSIALHRDLSTAGVANELVRIPGGEHGGYWSAWTPEQAATVWTSVQAFLQRHGLYPDAQAR